MTMNRKKTVINPNQLNFFDRLLQEKEERQQQRAGRLNLDAQLNAAVDRAIKQYRSETGKSLDLFCDELSEALGYAVKPSTINNFLAESHPHRWPASWIAAICIITGCSEPAAVTNDTIGLYTVKGPDALRAEIEKLDEEERKIEEDKRRIKQEKLKRRLFLQELEGKRC